MNKDPYQPIACGDYDIYEIAIMRRQKLSLAWREGSERRQDVVSPQDLQITNGEEHLVASLSTGEPVKIRLDRIVSAEIESPR